MTDHKDAVPAWDRGINERGIPWMQVRGRQLHSTMDPQKEARRSLQNPEVMDADLLVLFGAGMAWILQALHEINPEKQVIIFEPDLELASRARECRVPEGSLASWSESLKTVSAWDEWTVVSVLQEASCRKPVILANPALKAAFPEEFASLQSGLAKFLKRNQVNSNTLKRFGKLWVRNFSRNRPVLARAGSLRHLEGRFQGLPGMVLAGGPGLDEVLPLLGKLKERMVLVAVDTSLRACLRHGVDPDFVVTVDPQYWNSRHLDWTGDSKAMVITESSIYPRSLRQTGGPVYFCSSFFPLASWYEEELGQDFGKLGAGGSVATSAWDLLRILGCSESWISGLDLSCPGGKTHFHGALFEEQTHMSSRRLEPAEQLRFSYLHNDASFSCPTEEGGTVMTDHRMDIYVQWFENQAALYPQRIQLRTGKGNRPIRGLTRLSPEEALKKEARRRDIDRIRQEIDQLRSELDQAGDENGIRKADQELSSLLEGLAAQASRALELSIELKKLHQDGSQSAHHAMSPLIAELDRIDRLLMENPDSRIPGFLMEAEIMDIIKTGSPEDHGISAGIRLYQALKDVSEYHRKLFAPA